MSTEESKGSLRWRTRVLWVCLALSLPSQVLAQLAGNSDRPEAEIPDGVGQLKSIPELFRAGIDEKGREYFLNGQSAERAKLILTASNGFFDVGTCRAAGESSLPKVGDDDLIKPNFAFLGQWKDTHGTLRWHLWISKPGTVKLAFRMQVDQGLEGSVLKVMFAGQTRRLKTVESGSDRHQPWDVSFQVTKPGEHTLVLAAESIGRPELGVGELHTIDVYGPAMEDAKLLRARWRPAAVHGGYSSSKLSRSQMWVMSTQSHCDHSSYSPITTPFGYFGTSFEADRRVKGSFNFSMWAARSGGEVPPLHQMPHLLAAGSREAEFSGFGHEGSGVKLRGWMAMPDRPRSCVQALRVESDDQYDTYHGYFWDHPTQRWKLYAIGRKWNQGQPKLDLQPGSFCEIPGPPHVQRSGDQKRKIHRRGWQLGNDLRWHAMDTFHCRPKSPKNKLWSVTEDGQFIMSTGGMRHYEFEKPAIASPSDKLPEFLSREATQQLYETPANIQSDDPIEVGQNHAVIQLRMKHAGSNAFAEIHYGETDCLTFAKRKLHGTERNSVVSRSMQSSERSWPRRVVRNDLSNGTNLVTIEDLKPETTYYYRTLVVNDDGRQWTFQTSKFRTR